MVVNTAAIGLSPGDNAILESPQYSNPDSSDHCASFWFNMYGNDMGALNVFANIDSKGFTTADFTASG